MRQAKKSQLFFDIVCIHKILVDRNLHIVLETKNQEDFIITLAENTVILATGPAGTGKTKVAVAYGIEKLLNGYYKRLIVTRPVVEAGEHLGYLPGDFSEKIDPYLQPIYYELSHYLSKQELESFIKKLNQNKQKLNENKDLNKELENFLQYRRI